MHKPLVALFALLALCGQTAAQGTNRVSMGNVRMVMDRTVEDVARPGYAQFAAAASSLEHTLETLCESPSPAAHVNARRAFENAALAWARIEFLQFGPVLRENRLERVLFWPDRKSTGLKQVQAILAGGEESVRNTEALAQKSVAVQGLGALEYVLFGTGAEILAAGDPLRCGYGLAIAGNLGAIAGELEAEWASGSDASAQWTVSRSADDAAATLQELLGTMIHGLESVRDIRIRGFMNLQDGKDRPRQALFWRSGLTMRAIKANMQGLGRLFEESAMEVLLPAHAASIASSIRFEFSEIDKTLAGLEGPVEKLLADGQSRERLVLLDTVIKSLIVRFDTQFARSTGLTTGFSFADGD